ncbi:MAG TPA: ABC transporter permease subunit [Candidatus Acidoferrum sp.]|jgi:Cu-processing system permease protein|nr:ABC transporter permease subunit [Candidatus Acidoferrum sp.]
MMGCWVMAKMTFKEAARKKILWTALLSGIGFLALFGIALHFQIQDFEARGTAPFIRYQILDGMLMIGLYVVDLLAVIMAILTSVDTISGEITSGTIHAIATKPIPRWQIFLGKWIGFAAMTAAFVALTFGGTIGVAYAMGRVAPDHPLEGGLFVLLECLLALTVTFFFGTWFSTLTNGVLVLGLHGLAFMGGWLEQMSGFTESAKLVTVGVVVSLAMPSESIWRRAAFDMQSPLAAALPFSPFASTSIPSNVMIGYGAIYLLVALVAGLFSFYQRDL